MKLPAKTRFPAHHPAPTLRNDRSPFTPHQLWAELHRPPPPIGHPIPPLNALKPMAASGSALARLEARFQRGRRIPVFRGTALATTFLLTLTCGCQVLSYTSPQGERFSRSSLGANTTISSLAIESDTNGVRRVQMQGYQNDTTQALSVVTEAAVKAALQSVK